MTVDMLLDKINKFTEAKKTEHDNKVNSENALRDEYKAKIIGLAERIENLVAVGNAMKNASYIKKQFPSYTTYSNVLADFYEANKNLSMQFMCGIKRVNRANTEEDKKLTSTIVGIGYVDKNQFNDEIYFFVYPNGDVERLEGYYDCTHGKYGSPSNDYPVTSKILLNFLTEFDSFEKAVNNFIASLEV